MTLTIGNWFAHLLLLALLALPGGGSPLQQQAAQLVMTVPAACPPGGCAAGQRLGIQAGFALQPPSSPEAVERNVQLCFYTPASWGAQGFDPAGFGEVTSAPYEARTDACGEPPENFSLLGGLATRLNSDLWLNDSVQFAFRIGPAAAANGSLIMTVLEDSSGSWTRTGQAALTIPVVPLAPTVYVAASESACGIYSPCYINSAGDKEGGIGTGLKDAIDSQTGPVDIVILGNYTVKANTVRVSQPHTIRGIGDAAITYFGSNCANPLLEVTAGAVIRDLIINDGSCTTENRDLIVVNSPGNVRIESNHLLDGRNAVIIRPNTGNVTLRFNHVSGNSGMILRKEAGTGAGQVEISANNLLPGGPNPQVDCAGKGSANHNFWGPGRLPSATVTNCTVDDNRRLGARISENDSGPGVAARLVTVTGEKQYSFGDQIGFKHAGNVENFGLYLVNHGRGSRDSIPFGQQDNLYACSDYWDVFLAPGAAPNTTLDLYFKYSQEASCLAAIEMSTEYCKSSDAARFPLYWYDPAGSATSGWDTTGQTGQATACRLTEREIQVSIDNSGRPNLSNDLNYVPFVIGLNGTSLTSFTAQPGNREVTLRWRTASEVNTSGFFVQRSTQSGSGFETISDFIPAKGSEILAATYELVDTNLTNNTTYYYRLEIVNDQMSARYSSVVSAVPAVPTATPTRTPTVTRTPAPTNTRFATWTRQPTSAFRTATQRPRTPTQQRTSQFATTTRQPTSAFITSTDPITTRTAETSGSGYPAEGGTPEPPTGRTQSPGEVVDTAAAEPGTSPTSGGQVLPPNAGSVPPPVSFGGVLAGALTGTAVLALAGWFMWSRDLLPPFLAAIFPPRSAAPQEPESSQEPEAPAGYDTSETE